MDILLVLLCFAILIYSLFSFYAVYTAKDYFYKGTFLGQIIFFLLSFSSFLVGKIILFRGYDDLTSESDQLWLIMFIVSLFLSIIWWLFNKENFWKQ